jgi:hypothetical protein
MYIPYHLLLRPLNSYLLPYFMGCGSSRALVDLAESFHSAALPADISDTTGAGEQTATTAAAEAAARATTRSNTSGASATLRRQMLHRDPRLAVQHYTTALQQTEESLGDSHAQTARALTGLTLATVAAGDPAAALEHALRALQIKLAAREATSARAITPTTRGANDLGLAGSLSNVAVCYRNLGQL